MPANATGQVTAPAAGTYRIDPERTTITLASRHMFGTGRVAATFALREATLTVGEPATASTLHAVIDAASFASSNSTRDSHVQQPKFLHVSEFPDIVVDAQSAAQAGGTWVAPATITARGVTAPATITLEAAEATGTGELTLRGSVRVDRYAHGMTKAKGLAGRWMDLTITATGTRI
jgi:polyisoprenoid-binding protein YceI